VHHLRDDATHVLDLAVLVLWPLHDGQARGDVADLLGLVADALEVGDGLDDGDDQPQVAGGRTAGGEDAAAFLVDRHFHAVDLQVVGGEGFSQRAVTFYQRGDRLGEDVLYEATHGEHARAHPLQILIEPPRDVVGEICGFHSCPPLQRRVYRRLRVSARAGAEICN
jgi:hypothetical protein